MNRDVDSGDKLIHEDKSFDDMQSNLNSFNYHFFHALSKVRGIFFALLAWLVVDAAAIAYFEKMPFADALYFTFVTGLTIGYGDIAPVTDAGRVVAILTGLLGILITGLIIAVAVYALRETMQHPTDSN
jgi:hypothetical protein